MQQDVIRYFETCWWIRGLLSCAVLLSSPMTVSAAGTNLIADSQFEFGIAGFVARDAGSSISWSMQAPLEGAHSLRVSIAGYGKNVWSSFDAAGVHTTAFTVSAQLRSDAASDAWLQFCAMAYYADGETALKCTSVSGEIGDKGVITTRLDLDRTRPLATVHVRLFPGGSTPVVFTLDNAGAYLSTVPASGL